MRLRTHFSAQSSFLSLAAPLLILASTLLLLPAQAQAETYLVSPDGQDDAARDGLSTANAWLSLAYACDRVPEGPHTIQLASGSFTATRTAAPRSGVTVQGSGSEGSGATHIVAAADWKLSDLSQTQDPPNDEYLVALNSVSNVAIQNIAFESPAGHRLTGAIYCRNGNNIKLLDLALSEFRWNALNLQHSKGLEVAGSLIENGSTERGQHDGGAIRTRWIAKSRIHHNTLVSTEGRGYGYKGGGHEDVRIDHNYFNVAGEFAIESAHENEFGVEIDHNYLNRCVSVPKSGQGADPGSRGYEFSFWIHDNLMTDSYAVEGPRNHLRLSHNYIRIEKTGGRVYTQHGGVNLGPVWIHNNVIENVDRAFVWKNKGRAENVFVYNNTVFCAEAGDRADALISAPADNPEKNEGIKNWVVKNNIFVAPASQPRKLYADAIASGVSATDNICVNISNTPSGNFMEAPDLQLNGRKPWPCFAPQADGFSVDRGTDVGLPFAGKAPDLGAYESGEEQPPLDIPMARKRP
jgi:hypothetical protein